MHNENMYAGETAIEDRKDAKNKEPKNPSQSDTKDEYAIDKLPLLSRQEEVEYSQRINDTRRALNEALFMFHPVAKEYVGILRSLLEGEGYLKKIMDVNDSEGRTEHDLKKRLLPNIETVQKLLDANEASYAENNLEKIASTQQKIAILLEEIAPTQSLRAKLFNNARSIASSVRSPVQTLQTPEQLQHTLSELDQRNVEYNHARHALSERNTRLVMSIARRYQNRGLSIKDLIQEGSAGLMRAVDKFQHEKLFRFSTYATWWIKQGILRALEDQSRIIRLPPNARKLLGKINHAKEELRQVHNRLSTLEEVAVALGVPLKKVARSTGVQYVSSLDAAGSRRNNDDEGQNFIVEAKGPEASEEASANELAEAVRAVLLTLSYRERMVVQMRYGLCCEGETLVNNNSEYALKDGYEYTLEECGKLFGITRERIRQIEARALRRLQHSMRSSMLKKFIKNESAS